MEYFQMENRAGANSIFRNHPFFQSGGAFGWDWPTMAAIYPKSARILWAAIFGECKFNPRKSPKK